jgi:hypothetical protein
VSLSHHERSRCCRLVRLPRVAGSSVRLLHHDTTRCCRLVRLPRVAGSAVRLIHHDKSRTCRLVRPWSACKGIILIFIIIIIIIKQSTGNCTAVVPVLHTTWQQLLVESSWTRPAHREHKDGFTSDHFKHHGLTSAATEHGIPPMWCNIQVHTHACMCWHQTPQQYYRTDKEQAPACASV